MQISKSIFRAYDIRGVYPTHLDAVGALHIGKAVGTLLARKELKTCVVGRDDRTSSPELSQNFTQGLVSTGCHVTDVGVTLTPVIHFLTSTQDFDAGVNITASHNPKEFNGFRLDFENAVPFEEADLQTLYDLITAEDYVIGEGSLVTKNLNNLYITYLQKLFIFNTKFKVVLDCGNGASSAIAPLVFQALGCDVVPVHCAFDSDFPYGVPDPESSPFMQEVSQNVLQHSADIGFAFDTDGDRIGFVDDCGTAYATDKLLLLFAESVLGDNPGGVVTYDVKSSGILADWLRQHGGKPKMIETGHSHFTAAIKDGAILGGEFSGHVYFGDKYFGYDDGIYAALRILALLDEKNTKLSVEMTQFPVRVSTNELKVVCPDDKKFEIIDQLKQSPEISSTYEDIITIDGIRVQVTKTGWFLIRASNTNPYLSIRVEGIDTNECNFLVEEVKRILGKFDFLDLSPLQSC